MREQSAKGGVLDNQTKPSSSAGLHTSLWDERPPPLLHSGLAGVSRAMKSALWLCLSGRGVFHAPHTQDRPGQRSVQLPGSQPLGAGITEHARG